MRIENRLEPLTHKIKLLSLFLIFNLGACGQVNEPTEKNTASPISTPQPPIMPSSPTQPAISLSGEWRVAEVNGEPFDETIGIALKGNETELWWEPRCAGMARGYRVRGGWIKFSSLEPPRPPGGPTPPVCAIGLPPRLNHIFATLDAATSIDRTPENGIRIAGRGRSVTLFSQ